MLGSSVTYLPDSSERRMGVNPRHAQHVGRSLARVGSLAPRTVYLRMTEARPPPRCRGRSAGGPAAARGETRRSGRRSGGSGRPGARQQHGTYAFLPPPGGLDHPGDPRRDRAQLGFHRRSRAITRSTPRSRSTSSTRATSRRSCSRTRNRRSSSTWQKPTGSAATRHRQDRGASSRTRSATRSGTRSRSQGRQPDQPGRHQGLQRQHLVSLLVNLLPIAVLVVLLLFSCRRCRAAAPGCSTSASPRRR